MGDIGCRLSQGRESLQQKVSLQPLCLKPPTHTHQESGPFQPLEGAIVQQGFRGNFLSFLPRFVLRSTRTDPAERE